MDCALLRHFRGLFKVLSGKGETAIGKPPGRSEPVVFKEQARVSGEWRREVGKSYVPRRLVALGSFPFHIGGWG